MLWVLFRRLFYFRTASSIKGMWISSLFIPHALDSDRPNGNFRISFKEWSRPSVTRQFLAGTIGTKLLRKLTNCKSSNSELLNIVTGMSDSRRGLYWWMDLLTIYTHDSELQAITAPPLISTIHKPPQHPQCFSSPLCLHQPFPWQRLLTVEILQLHALMSSLHSLPYRTELNCSCPLLVTSRHGPCRKHNPSIVVVQLLYY
jgi:hypothetical protein